jgi:hypothetical protein
VAFFVLEYDRSIDKLVSMVQYGEEKQADTRREELQTGPQDPDIEIITLQADSVTQLTQLISNHPAL